MKEQRTATFTIAIVVFCVALCRYYSLSWFLCMFLAGSCLKLKILLSRKSSKWSKSVPNWQQAFLLVNYLEFAEVWHDYDIQGYDPDYGNNCLLVGYHSRPSIDLIYVAAAILPQPILFDLIFTVPVIKRLVRACGCIPSRENKKFVDSLAHGSSPIMVLPGGAYEALKPENDIYQVKWKEEMGFARLIVEEQELLGEKTVIVPFFTQNAERIAANTTTWINYTSKRCRQLLHDVRSGKYYLIPYLFTLSMFALGLLVLTTPVPLCTHFGAPIRAKKGETAVQLTSRVSLALQELMTTCNATPVTVGHRTLLQQLHKYLLMGIFIVFLIPQNLITFGVILACNWTIVPVALLLGGIYTVIRRLINRVVMVMSSRTAATTGNKNSGDNDSKSQ